MNTKTIEHLQHRTAQLAIGPSTVRNQGAPGVVAKAREFLRQTNLEHLSVDSKQSFLHLLDHETAKLKQRFPAGAKNWGTARKTLNVFLRDCVYHRLLCKHFKLARLHPWLELPMDKYAARGLRNTSVGTNLPRWRTIKGLKKEQHAAYQDVAEDVARLMGCYRVDLDIYLWRQIGIKDIESI